jgi:hypothetical protein
MSRNPEGMEILRPAVRRVRAARLCAAGCGAWADFEVGRVALCRDCAEALAGAYRRPSDRGDRGKDRGGSLDLR